MTEILLKANKISYKIGKKLILDDVSFFLHYGEILTIVGPNGAGKSSLVKILCGITNSYDGKLEFYKDNLVIGYVPQKLLLNRSIPILVEDFLALYHKTIDIEHYEYLIDILSIRKLLKLSLHDLSGGEVQKIMLARSMLKKPDLLVLDEPDQSLDMSGKAKLYELINVLHKKFLLSIIIISHDINLVMGSSNQIMCLNKHICCKGVVANIKNNSEFREIFGDKVSESLSIYHHFHNHNHE